MTQLILIALALTASAVYLVRQYATGELEVR